MRYAHCTKGRRLCNGSRLFRGYQVFPKQTIEPIRELTVHLPLQFRPLSLRMSQEGLSVGHQKFILKGVRVVEEVVLGLELELELEMGLV